MRDLHLPGRSAIYANQAAVATSHPLSSAAALRVLADGGNAMDAAITACAVQAVVEPQSTGIGGDCFALVASEGKTPISGLNGSGRAPRAASCQALKDQGLEFIPRNSPHAVTIPGAVDAWQRLLDAHGTWSLGRCLEPAIGYAHDGYIVSDRVNFDWRAQEAFLRQDPEAIRMLLVAEEAPQVGSRMRHPELGRTLESIASQGARAFYEGPLADTMVDFLRARGGLHTGEDFASAQADWVQPISTDYNGRQVWQIPPNGQGLLALIMLNIVEGFENEGLEPLSAVRLHREIEAARWAYATRDAYVGQDTGLPLEWLISKDYAAECRAKIDDFKASEALPLVNPGHAVHKDTVYISVVDAQRNAVSLINSTFNSFGSGLICPKTGVVFQNRGQSFNLEPGHPNALEGGKRPMHTIIPGMVSQGGRVTHCYGVMGGHYQPLGHLHVLTNMFDFGLNPQEALDLPRFMAAANGAVEVERGIPEAARKALSDIGHRLSDVVAPIGGGQVIALDHDHASLIAGSDPRKDGAAMGF